MTDLTSGLLIGFGCGWLIAGLMFRIRPHRRGDGSLDVTDARKRRRVG